MQAGSDVVDGVCIGCFEIDTRVEPDARNGFCQKCSLERVRSSLVVAGLI